MSIRSKVIVNIVCMCQIWQKSGNPSKDLATLFVLEVRKCFHWIPRHRKCGFSIKNYISMSIRSKVIVNVACIRQIWQKSGNPA